jgi:NADPH:quinone reductase-like Zn-dependent oxidoreductase
MTMRTIRFHGYGEAADVLRLEPIDVPDPGPARIRVRVHACGLNPADWALCRGLFAGSLPRGVGLEVSGVVDAIGPGVSGVAIGDRVLGVPDWAGAVCAGASDRAILEHWAHAPAGLDLTLAAALPMAVETAFRSLDQLGVGAGQRLLVHGAGTTIGYAAVQMAIERGARVLATAGNTYAERLRGLGAQVTAYGAGLVERVGELAAGPAELVLDCAPPTGALPDLVRAAGGEARRVLTISDFDAAAALGVRTTFSDESQRMRFDVIGRYAQRAAEQRFTIPIARTFALEEWRAALALSQSGHARGKLLLVPSASPATS